MVLADLSVLLASTEELHRIKADSRSRGKLLIVMAAHFSVVIHRENYIVITFFYNHTFLSVFKFSKFPFQNFGWNGFGYVYSNFTRFHWSFKKIFIPLKNRAPDVRWRNLCNFDYEIFLNKTVAVISRPRFNWPKSEGYFTLFSSCCFRRNSTSSAASISDSLAISCPNLSRPLRLTTFFSTPKRFSKAYALKFGSGPWTLTSSARWVRECML